MQLREPTTIGSSRPAHWTVRRIMALSIDLEGPAPRWATTDGEQVTFEQFLEEHGTVAFLVVYRDTIRYRTLLRWL